MANRKISDLTALTAPAIGDLLPIVDISEAAAADKNKKITIGELFASIPAGTAASPSIAFEGDGNTGIYSPSTDQLAISTNGTSRIVVDASGNVNIDSNTLYVDAANNRVGIGTTGPSNTIDVNGTGRFRLGGTNQLVFTTDGGNPYILSEQNAPLHFGTNSLLRATIDSSGRLLIGTSSARLNFFNGFDAPGLQVEGTGTAGRELSVTASNSGTSGAVVLLGKQRSGTLGGNTVVQNNDQVGLITYQGSDGTNMVECARVEALVDGTPGANDMPGRIVLSTTADGASTPTERMRIDSAGGIYIQKTSGAMATKGVAIEPYATVRITTDSTSSDEVNLYLNRQSTDGALIKFFQANTEEGSISVSGTTVSYNGAHLSRWSQLSGGVERTEILRGTVLSNINEMCDWGEEDNEQLNRMMVSDVKGDKNVSGVFQAWDDDDDTYTNDFYCAMTGDFIIRIAEGVVIERGDLLMSAGDGTAKPQDDDIIRSKTVAKVTSTHVTCTYEDGSYCVPCVLMAC